MRSPTDLYRETAGEAALDLAVTDALLAEVGARRRGAALRVYRPQPAAAFGRIDLRAAGFPAAAAAARRQGYEPLRRTVGGHAAVFDAGAVVVERVTPVTRGAEELQARYEHASWHLLAMLRRLGADAHVGELPGEYCPGRFSVHLGARAKVVGIAQRVTVSAALVSAVVVVAGGDRLRACLADIYAALDLQLDLGTVGALDEHLPEVRPVDVLTAVEDVYRSDLEMAPAPLDDGLRALAAERADRHRVP